LEVKREENLEEKKESLARRAKEEKARDLVRRKRNQLFAKYLIICLI